MENSKLKTIIVYSVLISISFVLCNSNSVYGRRVRVTSFQYTFLTEELRQAKTIGERVRILHEEKGFSLSMFAKAIGAAPSTIINWKRGKYKPNSKFIPKLAEVLEVDAWVLVTGTSKEEALKQASNIGERIYLAEYAKGLTANVIAEAIGTVREEIFYWEKGKCKPLAKFIPKLAEVLEIDAWVLFTGRGKEEALRQAGTIGERIYLARYVKGLGQEELAKSVARVHSEVSNWERGEFKPRPEVIPRLAKVLEVDAWVLVTGGGKEEALKQASNIGERIYLASYVAGMNQEKLGEEIGVTGKTVSNWVTGIYSPSEKHRDALSRLFDIEL